MIMVFCVEVSFICLPFLCRLDADEDALVWPHYRRKTFFSRQPFFVRPWPKSRLERKNFSGCVSWVSPAYFFNRGSTGVDHEDTPKIVLGRTIESLLVRACFTSAAPAPDMSGSLFFDQTDAGLVTIGGTGTGKGVRQMIPTALTYPRSMVIVDFKGEISAVTTRTR